MLSWFADVDRILRGEATRPSELSDDGVQLKAHGVIVVLVLWGVIYGACMGCFSVFRVVEDGQVSPGYFQMLASIMKTPLLYFLTLVVTFPSLYVFNALVGSRLKMPAVFKLLIASLAVNLSVLAALGPIVAFFSVSTKSYSFMVLLNVFVFALSGFLGIFFLIQTLNRITYATHQPELPEPTPDIPAVERDSASPQAATDVLPSDDELNAQQPDAEQSSEDPVREPGALDRIDGHFLGRHVVTVFSCWMIVFGLVGAQMGWVLRPFVGDPDKPFSWFRERDSNFFEAVWGAFLQLFQTTGVG